MRVAYDSEIFALQQHGGVSRLFSELIREFVSNGDHGIEPILSFKRTQNGYLLQLAEEKLISPFLPQRKYLTPNSPLRTLLSLGPVHDLSLRFATQSRRISAKLLHATYYRPTGVELSSKEGLVVTIHDFIPERLGWDWVKNPHYGKRKLISRANLVVCVSESTAQDLNEIYGDISAPTLVVPHGVRSISSLKEKLQVSTARPFVLYVGHRLGYKSFETLAQAIRILRGRNIDIPICSVGPEISHDEESVYADLLAGDFWYHLGNVDDLELRRLYKSASLTCVTSVMEGFGLPIIESLAEGTAVVASDIPVFREVGGNTINFFEISNPEALSNEISRALDNAWNRDLIQQRLERATLFTWSKAANLMARAYKSLE